MAPEQDTTRTRWTWNTIDLQWQRKQNKKVLVRSAGDFTSREADISDRNIMKQYKWILDQDYGADSHLRSKNTLVKRIPALSKDTARKTRNSVDGRLRSIFKKIATVIASHPDANIEMPEKLDWYRPAQKKKSDSRQSKLVNDIKSIFGS
mgnify:CR=1 FL=1